MFNLCSHVSRPFVVAVLALTCALVAAEQSKVEAQVNLRLNGNKTLRPPPFTIPTSPSSLGAFLAMSSNPGGLSTTGGIGGIGAFGGLGAPYGLSTNPLAGVSTPFGSGFGSSVGVTTNPLTGLSGAGSPFGGLLGSTGFPGTSIT